MGKPPEKKKARWEAAGEKKHITSKYSRQSLAMGGGGKVGRYLASLAESPLIFSLYRLNGKKGQLTGFLKKKRWQGEGGPTGGEAARRDRREEDKLIFEKGGLLPWKDKSGKKAPFWENTIKGKKGNPKGEGERGREN